MNDNFIELEDLDSVNGGGLAGAIIGGIAGAAVGVVGGTIASIATREYSGETLVKWTYSCTLGGAGIGAMIPTP
ncbi:hypothetical protein [Petroclostridium xylanilyticum]|jgi:hypothetical protein|uniref:hypothetical protein n=1 Tax=Petroclostridium xylanilyticum TaxID=1792311 RepID=UPI000B99A978|nr:hypothetical protein [Petroclostridium xylanilyticum]